MHARDADILSIAFQEMGIGIEINSKLARDIGGVTRALDGAERTLNPHSPISIVHVSLTRDMQAYGNYNRDGYGAKNNNRCYAN
jgi:hypothetical protein